jgi:hypothetical protein
MQIPPKRVSFATPKNPQRNESAQKHDERIGKSLNKDAAVLSVFGISASRKCRKNRQQPWSCGVFVARQTTDRPCRIHAVCPRTGSHGVRPSCAGLTHDVSNRSTLGINRSALPNENGRRPSPMMPSCQCFARRVKWHFGFAQAIEQIAQAIERTGPGYCAWGCFANLVLMHPKK